jgi:hypothetical protein
MQFMATLSPNSSVYRLWREHCRLSGILDGVMFRWDGKAFSTHALTTAEVEKLKARQDKAIKFEVCAVPPVEPDPEPAVTNPRKRLRLD